MLRTFLIALLIYATTLTALAQQTDTAPTPPRSITPRSVSDWPDPARAEKLPQSTLDIVTADKPKLRQHCQVHEIKADAITCTTKHHHPDTTYQRDEILAIIDPSTHAERNIMLIPIVLLAASLVGSFFVPLAWSITLRIFAGISLCVFGADGIGATGTDHNNDILIYQRPNTPLTLHLHAH